MANIFNVSAFAKPQQSRFDLSFDNKLTFSMGELVPVFSKEVLPGDIWRITPESLLRFMPLVSPVMHRVKVSLHFFFVPNRLLWPNWDDFITNHDGITHPYIPATAVTGGWSYGTVGDYLGYPTDALTDMNIELNPLPIAAYLKIFDEYYRDQNLVSEYFVPLEDGENGGLYVDTFFHPLRRAWQHDYFTACLPFAQKGSVVQVPLVEQNNIPVEFNADLNNDPPLWKNPFTGDLQSGPAPVGIGSMAQNGEVIDDTDGTGNRIAYDPQGSLTVDVQSGATTIETLRNAFRVQEWLERMARGGTRYIETILSHFGVQSKDSRLQRPEYLGGMKQNMIISEVLSTAQTDEIFSGTSGGVQNPVGQMAGHGVSVGRGNSFSYRATEHGWIMGIINVQPTTAYSQGIHKSLLRRLPTEYAWPTFANLGEQEVKTVELYASASLSSVFGYIPRYSEYKYSNSEVHAAMKDSLQFWHLGRVFDTTPTLNDEFIECRPRTDIFAVEDESEDHIISHVFFDVSVVRKLPRYAIPSI